MRAALVGDVEHPIERVKTDPSGQKPAQNRRGDEEDERAGSQTEITKTRNMLVQRAGNRYHEANEYGHIGRCTRSTLLRLAVARNGNRL